jgi:hypothetical protein
MYIHPKATEKNNQTLLSKIVDLMAPKSHKSLYL